MSLHSLSAGQGNGWEEAGLFSEKFLESREPGEGRVFC